MKKEFTVKGSSFIKSLGFVVGLGVIVIGFSIYKLSGEENKQSLEAMEQSNVNISIGTNELNNTTGQLGTVTPEFQKNIDQLNNQKAEEAKKILILIFQLLL